MLRPFVSPAWSLTLYLDSPKANSFSKISQQPPHREALLLLPPLGGDLPHSGPCMPCLSPPRSPFPASLFTCLTLQPAWSLLNAPRASSEGSRPPCFHSCPCPSPFTRDPPYNCATFLSILQACLRPLHRLHLLPGPVPSAKPVPQGCLLTQLSVQTSPFCRCPP